MRSLLQYGDPTEPRWRIAPYTPCLCHKNDRTQLTLTPLPTIDLPSDETPLHRLPDLVNRSALLPRSPHLVRRDLEGDAVRVVSFCCSRHPDKGCDSWHPPLSPDGHFGRLADEE